MAGATLESKSYWLKHVEAFSSGNFASKAAYCSTVGVSYHRFLYWYSKIILEKVNHGELPKSALFMPIAVTPERPLADAANVLCTLELKQGHKLKIYSEVVLEKLIILLSK